MKERKKNYEWTLGDLLVLLIGCRRSVKVIEVHTIASTGYHTSNTQTKLCARRKSQYMHDTAHKYEYIWLQGRVRAYAWFFFRVLSLSQMQIKCKLADKQCNSIWLLLPPPPTTTTPTTGKLFLFLYLFFSPNCKYVCFFYYWRRWSCSSIDQLF